MFSVLVISLFKMAKIYTVPGYETTYNHFYRAYCTKERDLNIRYEKKIIQLSELDAEMCKPPKISCGCSQIAEMKQHEKCCNLKKWSYLAKAKTEYTDKLGSLWANFTIKNTLPKKIKRGMEWEEIERLTPPDGPTYIYTLEENEKRKDCNWWIDSLAFSNDLQCRISREYQKRQFILTEKQLQRKS